jgi:hypothetical protein
MYILPEVVYTTQIVIIPTLKNPLYVRSASKSCQRVSIKTVNTYLRYVIWSNFFHKWYLELL